MRNKKKVAAGVGVAAAVASVLTFSWLKKKKQNKEEKKEEKK